MTLAWSKSDESGLSRWRVIPRNCGQLLGHLGAELRRFFTEEFDWDFRGDDDPEDDFIQTKDRVLHHAWLAIVDGENRQHGRETEAP